MRRLIESLTPDSRQVYWRWVGGMFGLYVVLMVSAAGDVHQPRIIAEPCGMNPPRLWQSKATARRHTRLRCRRRSASRYD